MNPYRKNVERGAALLDRECPSWRSTINLVTLDLSNGCFCILGQLFGHFDGGLYVLFDMNSGKYGFEEWIKSDDFQIAAAHGFTIDFAGDLEAKWQALQEAWVAELEGGQE